MNKFIILFAFSLLIWSCKTTVTSEIPLNSDSVSVFTEPSQGPGPEFSTFSESFTPGRFPFSLQEIPFFTDEETNENFHPISVDYVKAFINADATDPQGYYTGFAMQENDYIALIYFYSYSAMMGGLNYNTVAYLDTYSPDGKLISKYTLGEKSTRVNSDAQRVSVELNGNVFADKKSTFIIKNYLEDEMTSEGDSVSFTINPDGKIITDSPDLYE